MKFIKYSLNKIYKYLRRANIKFRKHNLPEHQETAIEPILKSLI